jgi:hypothetical protein
MKFKECDIAFDQHAAEYFTGECPCIIYPHFKNMYKPDTLYEEK